MFMMRVHKQTIENICVTEKVTNASDEAFLSSSVCNAVMFA
jgi:hypothetical protein